MAATLTLRRGGSAPFAQRYSAAGAAGSGWSGAALSLLVAAWDGDEADLDNLRALNWYRSGYGINDVESYATESALSNQTPTTTNTVTLSWSGPRRQPHHYSAYRMAGAAFLSDGTGLAQKILPSGAGEIAGNLLTASFASGAAVTERRLVPVLLVDGTTGAIDIPGNRTHSFLAGTSQVTLTSVPGWADGAKTVSAVTLTHTVNGEVTRLTLTGWGGGVTSSGGTCQYDLGPLCLNTSLWRPSLTFSLEYDLALSPRTQTGRDFNGRMVRLSQLTASPYERLGIELAYGGITAAHLMRLNKYAALGKEVELQIAESSDSQFVRVISGTLVQPNNPGAALRWGDTLRFEIEVDSCRWVSDERGFYAIRDRSASTFVIDGDYRSVFTPGRGFHVFGSTNNNKPWAVSSSSYDAATNRTTITVTGTVGATADGRIEVQEW